MALFKDALHILLPIEGGYVNDPTDRGGETYSGISRKWFPKWAGWKIVDSYKANGKLAELDKDVALKALMHAFYEVEFWNKLQLPAVDSKSIANEIFEMAVNIGMKPAVEIAQEAINLLNKAEKLYKNIEVDGDLGDTTIRHLNKYANNEKPLIRTINGLQFERYTEICRNDESQEKYFLGWLTRT